VPASPYRQQRARDAHPRFATLPAAAAAAAAALALKLLLLRYLLPLHPLVLVLPLAVPQYLLQQAMHRSRAPPN
jgi:hypothetical protein